jgi:hypothetical protein
MYAECAKNTDWNLFLLYSSTVFKLFFEETINKHHFLDRIGAQQPL